MDIPVSLELANRIKRGRKETEKTWVGTRPRSTTTPMLLPATIWTSGDAVGRVSWDNKQLIVYITQDIGYDGISVLWFLLACDSVLAYK